MAAVTSPTPGELAAAVATAARVRVAQLTDLAEHRGAEDLLRRSEPAGGPAPASSDLMRALDHAGNYVAGAWDGATLAGVAISVHAVDDRDAATVYAHALVVGAEHRRRGVGAALMAHQRAWALERGRPSITWLLDPLRRGPVAFSLGRLGAELRAYHCDYDGPGQDRCQVVWDLVRRAPGERPVPTTDEVPVALDVAGDGSPVPRGAPPRGPLRIALPPEGAPADTAAWREAMRGALLPALAGGRTATRATPAGWIILEERAP